MIRVTSAVAILAVILFAGCASAPGPTWTMDPDQANRTDASASGAREAMTELFNGGPRTKGELDAEARAAKMSRDKAADQQLEHAIHGGI